MTSNQRHLSPAALILFLYENLKDGILPLAGALIGSVSLLPAIPIYAVLIFFIVLILLHVFLDYWTFTYQLLDSEIIIHSGVFIKKINHVPYDRIQNITTSQWFFFKPFNLIELEVETAGHSEEPEVLLRAVPRSLEAEINQRRSKKSADHSNEIRSEKVENTAATKNSYTISWNDLLKFSLTSPAFLSGLLVVLAAYGKISNSISSDVYENIAKQAEHLGVLIIVGIAFLILLLFYLGSVVLLIIQYYRFTLTEDKGQFETDRGLLQDKKMSITFDRIQAVMVKQPWLRSLLHIMTVQLVIVSNSKKGDSEKDVIVMPVIVEGRLKDFFKQFFPTVPESKISQIKPNKWTYYYNLRNALIFSAMTIILVWLVSNSVRWLLITLIILTLLFWLPPAYFKTKRSKVEILSADFLALHTNKFLTKQVYYVPRTSIQTIEKKESIWLQKKSIATLVVNCRSGNRQRKIKVNYQSGADVQKAFDWFKQV